MKEIEKLHTFADFQELLQNIRNKPGPEDFKSYQY